MKGQENAKKMSSQIFYFHTFVTDIFRFKVLHFSFFWKSTKMQIGPQSVHFKVGFIHFDRRTLNLGAIFSNRFDHILMGEKIEILAEKS